MGVALAVLIGLDSHLAGRVHEVRAHVDAGEARAGGEGAVRVGPASESTAEGAEGAEGAEVIRLEGVQADLCHALAGTIRPGWLLPRTRQAAAGLPFEVKVVGGRCQRGRSNHVLELTPPAPRLPSAPS